MIVQSSQVRTRWAPPLVPGLHTETGTRQGRLPTPTVVGNDDKDSVGTNQPVLTHLPPALFCLPSKEVQDSQTHLPTPASRRGSPMQPLGGLSPGPADKTSCVSCTLVPHREAWGCRMHYFPPGRAKTLPNAQGIGSNTALPGTEAKPQVSPAGEAACLVRHQADVLLDAEHFPSSLLSSSFLYPPFLLPAPNTPGRITFTTGSAVYNLLWPLPCSYGKTCLVLLILQTRDLQLRDVIPGSRLHSWTWAHNWFHTTAV